MIALLKATAFGAALALAAVLTQATLPVHAADGVARITYYTLNGPAYWTGAAVHPGGSADYPATAACSSWLARHRLYFPDHQIYVDCDDYGDPGWFESQTAVDIRASSNPWRGNDYAAFVDLGVP